MNTNRVLIIVTGAAVGVAIGSTHRARVAEQASTKETRTVNDVLAEAYDRDPANFRAVLNDAVRDIKYWDIVRKVKS